PIREEMGLRWAVARLASMMINEMGPRRDALWAKVHGHAPVVEPGRMIISTVTVAHSRLKTPVSMARRAAEWIPGLEPGACAAARALSWAGRISRARVAAAAVVRTIEVISHPLLRTPRRLAVANPKRG